MACQALSSLSAWLRGCPGRLAALAPSPHRERLAKPCRPSRPGRPGRLGRPGCPGGFRQREWLAKPCRSGCRSGMVVLA
eukprot:12412666-Karenia_brevis.AAC.1